MTVERKYTFDHEQGIILHTLTPYQISRVIQFRGDSRKTKRQTGGALNGIINDDMRAQIRSLRKTPPERLRVRSDGIEG